jgi:hypothetical protein
MTSSTLLNLLPIPIIFVVVWLYSRFVRHETRTRKPNQKVFTYARSIKIITICGGIIAIVACAGYFIAWNNPTRDGLLYVALLFFVLYLCATPSLFIKFVLEESAVAYYSFSSKPKLIVFTDIVAINYSFLRKYVIKMKDGTVISLGLDQISGHSELLKVIENKAGVKITETTPNSRR